MGLLHDMRVDSAYFDLIKTGKKSAELRVNDEKRRHIMPGDKIRFLSRADAAATITRDVTKKFTAPNFQKLLQQLPVTALGGINEEVQLQELKKIYSAEEETAWGVVAFILGGEQNDKG